MIAKAPPLETSVEGDLRAAVIAAGGLCLKLPAILYRGIPDRLVLLPGARIFFVETKRVKSHSRTSIHQSRTREFLRTLGFQALIIHGHPALQEFIETHVKSKL